MNGEDFNIDEVTDRLGTKPTRAGKACDLPQASIDSGIAKTGWCFEVREIKCDDISIPFDKMFNLLSSKKNIILELCKDMNLEVTFCVILHIESNSIRALGDISREAISFVTSIKGSIGFDCYFY